ncbi:MAG: hypothetical protein JNJ99_14740, partial [Crocinitomicaceae bacterium]|nr:hypothetical protein [Crocinitomicaceae bacterium]
MKKSLFLFSSLFFTMGFAQITNGLVMDVPFTYGNVYDQIGTNYGVNVGATLTQDRFGKENMALHFNGAEYVYFPDNMSTNLDNLDEMSISVWIKPDDAFSGMRAVVAKWNGVTNEQYGLFQDGTNAVYAVRNINNIGTTVGLPV